MIRRKYSYANKPHLDRGAPPAGLPTRPAGAGVVPVALVRMDNVGIVVADLDAAVGFFTELGMELEGRMTVEGPWVDGTVGLDGTRSEIAMLRTPDGQGRVELATYHRPGAVTPQPHPLPPNTLGFHRVMFAVDDIDDTVARLSALGGEVVREVVDYEGVYRLCYFRGPEGVVIGLAQELGGS